MEAPSLFVDHRVQSEREALVILRGEVDAFSTDMLVERIAEVTEQLAPDRTAQSTRSTLTSSPPQAFGRCSWSLRTQHSTASAFGSNVLSRT
jgi:hypothetical protein